MLLSFLFLAKMQILNIEKNFVENKIFFSYPLKFSEIG